MITSPKNGVLGSLLLQRDIMTMTTLIRKYLIGVCLQFQGLVHYNHGVKHDGLQADIVLNRYWSAGSRKREWHTGPGLSFWSLKPHLSVTCFLQEGNAYFHKTTPPIMPFPMSLWCNFHSDHHKWYSPQWVGPASQLIIKTITHRHSYPPTKSRQFHN